MPNFQLRRRACQAIQRISKETVLALVANEDMRGELDNPLNPIATNIPEHFLKRIPLDHWEIRSFDPMKLEVCVDVYNFDNSGKVQSFRVLTFALPELGAKS